MFLYGSESWTVDSGLEKCTLVFENNCHIGLLRLHYTTHKPNVDIHRIVTEHLGNHDALLEIVKSIVIWFGHGVRAKESLTKTSASVRVRGERSRGKPTGQWLDDVKE